MKHEAYCALLIGIMSLATIGLRALPFALFGGKRQVPPVVSYLGEVLPGAVLGMLVIYCLRDLQFTGPDYGLPELISCGAVILVQLLKRNSLLSILVGTLVYMLIF